MNVITKAKNLELTESLEGIITKRLSGLKKMLKPFEDKVLGFLFQVSKETKHHRKGDVFWAEAIVTLPGKKITVTAHDENLLKAITKARDELKREISRYKTKMIEMPRRAQRKSKEK